MRQQQIKVHLRAFGNRERHDMRIVEIPDVSDCTYGSKSDILDRIFIQGQNDFHQLNIRSVSSEDIIEYDGEFFGILMAGYKKLNSLDEEFDMFDSADLL